MRSSESIDVIAIRNLYFTDLEGNRHEAVVELARPEPTNHPNEFLCRFRVSGIGNERVKQIFGIDNVQALQLAMNAIGPYLTHLQSKYGITLGWDAGEGEDLGFQVEKESPQPDARSGENDGAIPATVSKEAQLSREFHKFQQRWIKAHRRGDAAGELAEIENQILNGSPELKAQTLEYRARFNVQRGEYGRAKEDYFLALELAESSHLRQTIQAGIARICEAEGDLARALEWFRKTLHEGEGGGYSLPAILRLNGNKIDESDRVRAIEVVRQSWTPFNMPGEPNLNDLPGCIRALDDRLNQIADEAMILPDIGEVIAERHLVYVDEHGVEHPALVQLGKPRASTEHEGYVEYFFRITGLDFERVGSGIGVDSIDAIRIAMNVIGADLEHIKSVMEGEVRWAAGDNGDLGFPRQAYD